WVMPDTNTSLWSVIDARDAGIARLHESEKAQHATLVEKESAIQLLRTETTGKEKALRDLTADLHRKDDALRDLTADLQQKEGALRDLTADLQQKEGALRDLTADLRQKEDALRRLTADLADKESSLTELTADVTEKEAVIRELEAALEEKASIKRLNTTLEEKEAVIREQVRALEAYRATFAVVGVFVVPLNHFVLGMRSMKRLTIKALVPKLGVLYQHPPCEMRIPESYSHTAPPAAPPKISIVTPSFKQAAFIERTLRSVLDQGYPNLEYYVQDGGSEDGTAEVLKRHEDRLAGWQSRPDRGQAQAINRAFAKTSGDIMAYLNSDDILMPGALAYVADYFERHPEVDVVYGHRVVIDDKDQQIGRWIMPAHDNAVLAWADFVPQETLFWRRGIWEKAGGRMDESFQFALDWDLLVRFRDAGARFARLPRLLGGFRVHPQQKTTLSIADTGFQEMNRIRQRVLGRVPTSEEVRKAVLPYLAKHMAKDFQWEIGDRLGMHS
ncbi:MAG: glycosyltransferase, partial [Usitatibacter sp.]